MLSLRRRETTSEKKLPRGGSGKPRAVKHTNGNGSAASQKDSRGVTRRRQPPGAVVAGGAGFLGSHLCDRLIAEGYRVYCVDSFHTGLSSNVEHLANEPRFVLMEHDIRTPVPALRDVCEIYNLACPASPPHYQKDPVGTVTTNVVGTLNLLELAASVDARFLLTSTSEVYGDPEVHPQPETYRGCVSSTGPRACYDEGKRVAETLCFDFLRAGRADVRVTRIFNTYGPRMRPDDGRIISNLITQALAGDAMTIYGSGEQTRSFCYVSDLIGGILALMRLPSRPEGPVNLGNPGEFTILELAGLVTRLTGSNVPVVHRPLPKDDPQRRCPDIALAGRLLGWTPKVALEDGLKLTIEWFAEHLENTVPELAVDLSAGQLRRTTTAQPALASRLAR